jgi:hypothetical protein
MADVQITVVDQQDVQMAVVDQNDAQIALTPALDAQLALAAPAEAQIIAAAPTFQGAVVESIDDLSDVDTSGVAAGQVLQWNGSKWVGVDFDAARYIAEVQGADGQSLEPEVQDAINQFVMGCKSDGIWNAIKASCILAGARTLNGALVPLKGTAPTNFNFVAGDYNRKTGLIGNGSTKYLDSNRADNADPQNNAHLSVFVSSAGTGGTGVTETYIGGGDGTLTVSLRAIIRFNGVSSNSAVGTYNRFNNFYSAGSLNLTGFIGNTRNASAEFISRANEVNTLITATSRATDSTSLGVFVERRDGATLTRYASCRLSFYSIGESLDLALLDSRVTTLMSDITAAIP